ncbi:hypothetical protein P3T18_005098 [Paraburkholderia sp. GAS199]|uniref:hypothetical protein n=1 Tax=Paraburkholderia sp. GAS199 TaxID=3035126 RepID=UPI003D2134B7
MNVILMLEILTAAVALLCIVLVPVAIGRDPGLARRVVQMDALPRARWPNLLTRAGVACMLVSFALLLFACYQILNGANA